jgi:hypothetical protein
MHFVRKTKNEKPYMISMMSKFWNTKTINALCHFGFFSTEMMSYDVINLIFFSK